MNHTVKLNTYHSPIREKYHREFAGEITEESFNTYDNRNPRMWFTQTECNEWKRIKDEALSKKYEENKGGK